jgi:hypothetical protein
LVAARVLPVATGLISTEVGWCFYLKFGFEKVGKSNVGAMNQVRGGSIMFYERHLQDQVMKWLVKSSRMKAKGWIQKVSTGKWSRLQGVSEAKLGMRERGYSPKSICQCLPRNSSRIGKRLGCQAAHWAVVREGNLVQFHSTSSSLISDRSLENSYSTFSDAGLSSPSRKGKHLFS